MIAALLDPTCAEQELTWLEQRLANVCKGSVKALTYLEETSGPLLWQEVLSLEPEQRQAYRDRLQKIKRVSLLLSGGLRSETPQPELRRIWHLTSALHSYLG